MVRHTHPFVLRALLSPLRALRVENGAAVLCVATITVAAAAQDLGVKAPPQAKPVAILNATVHPVVGPALERGYVLFEGGRISEIGTVESLADRETRLKDWEVIDAGGDHLYPGLIAAYTQLGLTEISAVRATRDYSERGEATPEVRAAVAVNPDSTLIPVARSNGVLAAGVFPAPGAESLVPGRASVLRLDGWTWEEMAVTDDAGLVVNWPLMRTVDAWWMNQEEDKQTERRDRALRAIREVFDGAEAYRAARAKDASVATDIRYEAMLGVLPPESGAGSGGAQKPVYVLANDYDQIQAAVAFCTGRGLRCVIVGGMDAPQCAELLKRHDVPVLVTGTVRFPKRDDAAYDDAYTLPARLEAAGVRWCLSSGEEAAHERNLPYAAGLAVAHGLDHDAGLRSITLSAAEVLGVSDSLGSIEAGKSATVFLCDGDILEVTSNVTGAWIDGRRIDLRNKQTELEAKYREKYRQIGSEGGAKRAEKTDEPGAPATGQ